LKPWGIVDPPDPLCMRNRYADARNALYAIVAGRETARRDRRVRGSGGDVFSPGLL